MIKVKSNVPGNRMALWERHPDHPNGEVFVAGNRVVEVAETDLVRTRLKMGWLVEVSPPKKSAKVVDKTIK